MPIAVRNGRHPVHAVVYEIYVEYTNVSIYNTTIYFIYFKIVYRQGDMFRPSLGHPQALKENGSKTT